MATTSPGFAEDRRSIIYRRVYEVLRNSARLAGVKSWIFGLGAPEDRMKPVESMMPWIRAWPSTQSVTRRAEGWNYIEFALYLEIATPGVDWTTFLNLWGAIEDSLANDVPTHGTTVRDFIKGTSQGKCDGALFTGIQQDASFTLRDEQNQIIGRVGRGIILFPFGKRA